MHKVNLNIHGLTLFKNANERPKNGAFSVSIPLCFWSHVRSGGSQHMIQIVE
jgi:hypothetical protein